MPTFVVPAVKTGMLLAAAATASIPARHARVVAEGRPAMTQVVAQRLQPLGADSTVQFRLSDQFGQVHDAADYRGHPLYVVGANRVGRASATTWATTLGPLLVGADGQASAAIVPVADLGAVPRFLRGFVRRRFPADRRRAVLLDWDGTVARRLAFDPARSTILAVGADGRPVLRLATLAADSTSVALFVERAAAAMRVGRADRP